MARRSSSRPSHVTSTRPSRLLGGRTITQARPTPPAPLVRARPTAARRRCRRRAKLAAAVDPPRRGGMLLPALLAALLALLAAVELGQVPVRLPFPPGVEYDYMAEPPPGSLPVRWDAGFKPGNEALAAARVVLADRIVGVETVAVAPDGRLGLVDKWGQIFIATPDGAGGYALPDEPLAYSSPGRTLGAAFDAAGDLYIANSPLGLLQLVSPGGGEAQRLLLAAGRVADESPLMPGHPVEFANDLDIASDGTVYLSCSTDVLAYKTADSSWDALDSVYVTLAKGAPAGMLLAHHPGNGSTTALMAGLWFANGVALSHGEEYVLVADSIQARIHRYWLKGPRAGSSEVFADNLPGPPDGVSRASDGNFWVAIYGEVPGIIAQSHRRLVRLLIAWAPRLMRLLRLHAPRMGLVLKLSPEGKVLSSLADTRGAAVWGVTSAVEARGALWLGSLGGAGVRAPTAPARPRRRRGAMERALNSLGSKLRAKSRPDLTAPTSSREYPADPSSYELMEDIGRGVSATVHRALCLASDEIVAVKKMNLERVSMTLEEIIHEAQTMKSYHHANVLPLFTSFVHGQDLWMVTPYMAGGSVLHIMKYQYPEGLDEVVIATIMKYVLLGLEYVHKNGGIHRDVKAGNILIDRDGTVRIGDFGVAATIERQGEWGSESMPRTTFVGTPCWMAPEVMEQTQGYRSSADIWSFGITMLEMANGHAPFAKFPPMKVLLMTLQNPPPQLDDKAGRKHFSKGMRNLVARCLQKDPASRPSATELLQDKFFKQARDEEFLQRTLMAGLPGLGERVQQIRVGKAATTAAENDRQLERSQEEYVKGVSSWNFNIAELRAQAACEPDDSVPATPTFAPSMPTIAEGPEPAEPEPGAGSGGSSRRSTDDAAAAPLAPAGGVAPLAQEPAAAAAPAAEQPGPAAAAPPAQPEQPEPAAVQQAAEAAGQQQQQQLAPEPAPAPAQRAEQQQPALQQPEQQAQLQQQQAQQQQGGMRRAASAFAGSPALAAAAAAAGANITAGSGAGALQGHFSEPVAPGATAVGSAGGAGGLSLASLAGSPPMSRESSSTALTPDGLPLKGKSKGRHGRFQVYEHGEEPPPMSPPAGKGLAEGLAGSFSRSGALSEGRVSDPAGDTPRQVLPAAEAAELAAAAAAAAAAACNGGAVVGFAPSDGAATGSGTVAASGTATPVLGAGGGGLPPPAPAAAASGGGAPGVAGVAGAGGATVSTEGGDGAGGAEPKKRGRFKIIEEDAPSLARTSVSKTPSSADLGGKAGRGLLGGGGVLPELLRLHEHAASHQAALARLIEGVRASSSLGNLAGEDAGGGGAGAGTPAPGGAVARKLSTTGSLSRSASSKALGGWELGRLSVPLLLQMHDGDAADVAERLLERGQELERRLAEVVEENNRLRLRCALYADAAGGGGSAAGEAPAGARGASAAGEPGGSESGAGSRAASRRPSTASHLAAAPGGAAGATANGVAAAGAAGQAAAPAGAAGGNGSGGGASTASTGSGGPLGERHSSGGNSANDGAAPAPAPAPAPAKGATPRASASGGEAAADCATAAAVDSLARESVASALWHKS
ncbi:OXSR1 [Scenedesmus sp. PABB004]|nr:OXSR1 [Scenedesmus sp. PABB004]